MPDSPFKLLEPYHPNEKDFFFGRDKEIYALYHLLKQTRLVLVYGASGTGKTSLIHAGLPKAFKLSNWLPITIRRKNNINEALGNALGLTGTFEIENIQQAIQETYQKRWMPLYLIFDQFEEIFTIGKPKERTIFFENLQQLLKANLPCKVILSMREEYIGHLYEYEPILPQLFEKRFRLEQMKDGTIKEVVRKMCAQHVIQLENGSTTIQEIVNQIKLGKQAYLPYLQIYLHYLYIDGINQPKHPIFTLKNIENIGAIGDVLKNFIDTQMEEAQGHFSKLGAADNFARKLLDEFSTIEGTKQSKLKTDLLADLKVSDQLLDEALIYFSDTSKLLRADENEIERYEPVHDIVAKQIHGLRSNKDVEYKLFEKNLQESYHRWSEETDNSDLYLHGTDLSRVEIFKEKIKEKSNYDSYLPWIQKSQAHLYKKKLLRQVVIGALIASTIFAFGFAYKSTLAEKEAERQADLANKQKIIAEEAFKKYKLEQSKVAQKDVERIMKGAKEFQASSGYKNIADSLYVDAKKELNKFRDNEEVQKLLDSLEQSFNQK